MLSSRVVDRGFDQTPSGKLKDYPVDIADSPLSMHRTGGVMANVLSPRESGKS